MRIQDGTLEANATFADAVKIMEDDGYRRRSRRQTLPALENVQMDGKESRVV
jgi:predicted double-glycine peptidase